MLSRLVFVSGWLIVLGATPTFAECLADWGDCCEVTDCDCACGTLFLWNGHPECTGGPDLDAPLITDRPDFTESSVTVGRNVLQIEMGYTFTEDGATGGSRSHSYPETLFRYGVLAEWLELRVGWNYAQEQLAATSMAGSEDVYLGLKLALTPQCGWLPEMALLPQMNVPTGADAFSADELQPGLNWVYSWELNGRLSTGGSTQFNRALDDGTSDAYTEWAQSWTVAASVTDDLGIYTEWFAFFPHSADTAQTEHYFNGGFTYLLNDNLQWDIFAGVGLNGAADDYFIGSGLSIRLR